MAMPTLLPAPCPSGPVVVSTPVVMWLSGWPGVLLFSLPKPLDLLHRHGRFAGRFAVVVEAAAPIQVQHRIEQHRRMARGEHEPVAVRPKGVLRIVFQEELPKGVRDRARATSAFPGARYWLAERRPSLECGWCPRTCCRERPSERTDSRRSGQPWSSSWEGLKYSVRFRDGEGRPQDGAARISMVSGRYGGPLAPRAGYTQTPAERFFRVVRSLRERIACEPFCNTVHPTIQTAAGLRLGESDFGMLSVQDSCKGGPLVSRADCMRSRLQHSSSDNTDRSRIARWLNPTSGCFLDGTANRSRSRQTTLKG